jgi:hypothetical protein
MYSLMRDVIHAPGLPDSTIALFTQLKWLMIVIWSLYPIVCGLGRAHLGLISVAAGKRSVKLQNNHAFAHLTTLVHSKDALTCIMDSAAKIGMEMMVIHYLVTLDQYDGHAVHLGVNGTIAAIDAAGAHHR